MRLAVDQFAEHLNDRLRMLTRSAEAYDQGDYAEAIRLAGSIVKLIGDRKKKNGEENKNFISLSTRLGIKPTMMTDTSLTGAMDKEHLHGPLFILGFHVTGADGLVPILDGFEHNELCTSRLTPFEKWWNDPIIRDGKGSEFSRRMIIETMRDQEDAHSDGDLNPEYASIAYEGAIGITKIELNEHKFDINPARVAARQIAHEVLRAFSPNSPKKWLHTRGLKVQPIILQEIQEQDHDGKYIQILDHKAIEFKAELTSSPDIWREWSKFTDDISPAETTSDPQQSLAAKNWLIRIALINYAPYPIECVQAMVNMQHPVG